MSQIGAEPAAGVTRLAYSPVDLEVRTQFIDRAGVAVDPVGNSLTAEPGAEGDRPVLSGSHLDSAPRSGCSDSALGVLLADSRHRKGS